MVMPPRPTAPGCGCLLPLILVFVTMTQAPHPFLVVGFIVLLAVYAYMVRDYRAKMRIWLTLRDQYLRMHQEAAAAAHAQASAEAYRRAQHASSRARYSTSSSQGYSGSRRSHSAQPARPLPSEPDPHEVLQVPRGADSDTIRSAYRKLASQYHPDRVANLGPEFRALAEEKMKGINAAYAKLRNR